MLGQFDPLPNPLEERDRVPVAACRATTYTVLGCDELAAHHARHQMSDIDYERPGHVGRRDPVSSGIEDLKPACRILVQQREQARVRVRRAAQLLPLPSLSAAGGGIVEQSQGRDVFTEPQGVRELHKLS